jgi:hypothetical protein
MSTTDIKVALHIQLKFHPNTVLTDSLTFKELVMSYSPIVAGTLPTTDFGVLVFVSI